VTLRARRFSPAPGVPGGPKAIPLPLGRDPIGSCAARAAAATPRGERSFAEGSTWWNSAHAPAKPVRAGAVIDSPYRRAYSFRAHSSARAASGVRLEVLKPSPSATYATV